MKGEGLETVLGGLVVDELVEMVSEAEERHEVEVQKQEEHAQDKE